MASPLHQQFLSSDILEDQFGPTVVKIVHQDETTRIIQTVVANTGQVLELSLVRFIPVGVVAFPEAHRTITSGESIGKAFRAQGIEFRRNEQFACRYPAPHEIHQLFKTDKPTVIVSVQILVGPDQTPYADIIETFTGDVVWPKTFGTPTRQALDSVQLLGRLLDQI